MWIVMKMKRISEFGLRIGEIGKRKSKIGKRPEGGTIFLPQRRRASFAKAREAKKRGGVFVNVKVKVKVNGNLGGRWRGV